MPFSLAELRHRAVDRCYRTKAFTTELQRLEFLFGLYQELAGPV